MWHREKTDWNQLEAVVDWVVRQRAAGLDKTFREMFAGIQDQKQVADLVEAISVKLVAAREETSRLADELKLDCFSAFAVHNIDAIPFIALAERCAGWLGQLEELTRWNNYFLRASRACALGFGAFLERIETGAIPPAFVPDAYDRIYYSQLLREIVSQKPALAQFEGVLHTDHVEQFRQLDKERPALAKYRVLLKHYQEMPATSGVGPAGIVKAEIERKRGHRLCASS